MEGVAFSLKDCLDVFAEMDIDASVIRLSGGGSASDLWRRIFADVFDADLEWMQNAESGTRGAAILAGVAAGTFKDVVSGTQRFGCATQHVAHDRERAATYRRIHPLYRTLYTQLKPAFCYEEAIHRGV